MSQAEELLNDLTNDETSAFTTNPETEEHIIIGLDRVITVPQSLKRIAVQHDHNMETVTFDCPRYWDGIDMSVMKVLINYVRADGKLGSYKAENVAVDESDNTIMHFTWTITRNVSDAKGNIAFLVCARKTDSEGNEENHWSTELNKVLYVSEGLDCHETIVEMYPDVITQILEQLESSISVSGKSAYEYAKDGGYTGTEEEFSTKLAEENPTREEFNSLSEEIADLKESGSGATPEQLAQIEQNKNDIQILRNDVNDEESERKAEIAVERARINSFTRLSEGSTTGDAELIDARVDYKGITHTNVGEHLRAVATEFRDGFYNYLFSGYELLQGSRKTDLTVYTSDSHRICTSVFVLKKGTYFEVNIEPGYRVYTTISLNNINGTNGSWTKNRFSMFAESDMFLYLTFGKTDDSNIDTTHNPLSIKIVSEEEYNTDYLLKRTSLLSKGMNLLDLTKVHCQSTFPKRAESEQLQIDGEVTYASVDERFKFAVKRYMDGNVIDSGWIYDQYTVRKNVVHSIVICEVEELDSNNHVAYIPDFVSAIGYVTNYTLNDIGDSEENVSLYDVNDLYIKEVITRNEQGTGYYKKYSSQVYHSDFLKVDGDYIRYTSVSAKTGDMPTFLFYSDVGGYDENVVGDGAYEVSGAVYDEYIEVPSNANYFVVQAVVDGTELVNNTFYVDNSKSVTLEVNKNKIFRERGTFISNQASNKSSASPQVCVDEMGVVYCIYLGSHSTVGESHEFCELAVFPLTQPYKVEYYSAQVAGEFGTVVDANIFQTADNSNVIRITFTNYGGDVFYRDFYKDSKTFGDFAKINIVRNGEAVPLTATIVNEYLIQNGYNANGGALVNSANYLWKDGYLYGVLSGEPMNPIVFRTNDNMQTVEFCGIVPAVSSCETAICFNDDVMYVANRGISERLHVSYDFGSSYQVFSNVKEYFTTTQRPQIFSYNNKVYIANGKPTKLADNQCRDTRNNVSFYVGEGANFRDYKQQIMLVEELGLVYYRIFEYNEILYIIYGTGILYSNLGDNQGKDVLKFVSLRDIID